MRWALSKQTLFKFTLSTVYSCPFTTVYNQTASLKRVWGNWTCNLGRVRALLQPDIFVLLCLCVNQQTDPIEFVENICENMQLFPKEDFLTGDQLMFEYDPQVAGTTIQIGSRISLRPHFKLWKSVNSPPTVQSVMIYRYEN